jgi:glycosyltransferase involved in cell wall biosynthesis
MHPQDSPQTLSVIIPALNAAAYVASTIESVLAQNYPVLEIIVIDDGSTDDTLTVVRQFGAAIRVIAAPHRGLAATRNHGISEARGELILHLDSDDLLTEGSIARRVVALGDANDVVTGRLECFISPDVPDQLQKRFVIPERPQHGHLAGASIVRATVFRDFGNLDESFTMLTDLEWWVRARDRGARIRKIDDIVLRRRIHGRNISILRKSEHVANQLRIVKSSLQRRCSVSGRRNEKTT